MSTTTLPSPTDQMLAVLGTTLSARQTERLLNWAATADVRAAGLIQTSRGRELHALVRTEAPDGANYWSDRMVFANGLAHSSPVDLRGRFGLPDPLLAARLLAEQIQAAGGFVADGTLDELRPAIDPAVTDD